MPENHDTPPVEELVERLVATDDLLDGLHCIRKRAQRGAIRDLGATPDRASQRSAVRRDGSLPGMTLEEIAFDTGIDDARFRVPEDAERV